MTPAEKIKEEGFCFQDTLSPKQVWEVLSFLKQCPVYPGCHVIARAALPWRWDETRDREVVSWHPHDVLRAPHFFEHFLQGAYTAKEFLEVEVPKLYYVNAFCTRPAQTENIPFLQEFHVDHDDTKFLPMFTFLTDVGEDSAQEIVMDPKTGRGVALYGAPGTTFFSDTSRPHRGRKPTKERIIMWARWGVSDKPAAYVQDKLYPMKKEELGDRYPSDPWLQETIKLLVE